MVAMNLAVKRREGEDRIQTRRTHSTGLQEETNSRETGNTAQTSTNDLTMRKEFSESLKELEMSGSWRRADYR